ncbi:unnamed protein product [Parnassius apollo]|uniref:(apollo) hypothetical protein n=1 Tax=Parnassius apollo TaxID=110799 RepID=A0A8S3WKN4_PARAO|nr:unnamed protein product [Parnassius apollo]
MSRCRMIRAGRVVVVAVAAVLVCCNADPHREQDGSVSEHSSDRYDANDYRQRELQNFWRFLWQKEHRNGDRNLNGIGGSTLLGRNVNSLSVPTSRGSYGKIPDGIGGSTLLGRDAEGESNVYARFVDALGGGNFVRNLDSLGGGNFVRNLDSLGGSNFIKRNLDQIGGPNFVKRNLDSLGGGNFVRNLDPLGGDNFVRSLDDENFI